MSLKPGETVVFSWIVFKSRAQRDRVNAKVMKDPRVATMMDPKAMPFDAKRMVYGGFEVLVDLEQPVVGTAIRPGHPSAEDMPACSSTRGSSCS